MTVHLKRALLRLSHNKVLAVLFILAAIMHAVTLGVQLVRGEPVSPIFAAWATVIGGGAVWSYLFLTGRLKAE